jgi:deoxyribose-phosphate aldolase
MNNLNTYIEQTLLRPDAVEADFIKLFEEAREHKFFGVCINPNYVELAKKHLDGTGVKIVTVVGFPLGANKPEIKSCETAYAVLDGADEIDMVINIGALKAGEEEVVINDIKEVKNACKDKALKVIIETDLLTQDEIRKACELCVEAGADFVKTSTGFVKDGAGAKPEDVALMHEIVSPHGLQVKASGGIRDKEKALKLIAAGATRLGTSAGAAIVS